MGLNFFEIMEKEQFILGHSFPDEEGEFTVKAVISLRKFNSCKRLTFLKCRMFSISGFKII